jgi:large subunit ribosomal protein L22
MEAKASVKYLRIGPRKARVVLDLVRRKYVTDAFDILTNMNRKGARMAEQLLKSAVANAKGKKMDESALFIDDIRADGGPIMKRFMPRSMGRADRVLKRTTHMSVRLLERPKTETTTDAAAEEPKKKTTKKRAAAKKPASKKTAAKKPAAQKKSIKAKK